MTLVTASIDIDAPREKVFETVLDPTRLDEWVTIHRKINDADGGARTRATRWSRRCACAARTSRSNGRSPSSSRPDRATWEGRGPAHSYARTAYKLSDRDGGGTHFDYENEFKAPGGFLGAAAAARSSAASRARGATDRSSSSRQLLEQRQ